MSLLYPFLLFCMSLSAVSCGSIGAHGHGKPRMGYDYMCLGGQHAFTDSDGANWTGVGGVGDLYCAGHSSTGEERNDTNTAGDKRDAPAWSDYEHPGIYGPRR